MIIITVIFIAPYFTDKGEHIKLYKNYLKTQSNIIILYLPAHHTHIIYYNHIVFPCTPHTNTRTEACRRNVMPGGGGGGEEEDRI